MPHRLPVRSHVLELLRTLSPLSLAELHAHLRSLAPGLAFSTVFRNVRALEEQGRIVRVDWRDRGGRYEAASLPHHHHVRCRRCHKVVDLTDAVLPFALQSIETATGFSIERHTIELEGVCHECRAPERM